MLAPGDFPMPWEDDANPPEAFQSHASKRASLRKDAAARDKIANSLTGNRAWEAPGADLEPETSPSSDGMFGKQRLTALAATVALALVAGAVGGGLLATSDHTHVAGSDSAASGNRALEAAMARIDADLLAVKASVENTSRLGMVQFSQTSERLDKLEKAQAEPAAKLGKLSEALELAADRDRAGDIEGYHGIDYATGHAVDQDRGGAAAGVAGLAVAQDRQWGGLDREP
jgi:hypothetical protein